jgi:uncharacterized protein (DUF433 family)
MSRSAEREHCESRSISLKHEHWKGESRWCRERFISTAKDFDVSYSSVLDNVVKQFGNVSIDSEILGGTPRISGTRVPVYMILDAIEHYGDLAGAIKSYPHLTIAQVKDAVRFAAQVLEHPVEYEP